MDSDNPRGFRFILRIIIGLTFVAAVGSFFILLDVFPHRPNSLAGWLILVGVGVPLWLLLEWLGEVVFSKRVGQRVSGKPFSGTRILYGLGVFLVFFVGMFLLWTVLVPYVQPYFS